MTIRDIGLWIKALWGWIDSFIHNWAEVVLWQTNWLDANVLHVLLSLGFYFMIPYSGWFFVADHLDHRRKLKENKDYREKWELKQHLLAKDRPRYLLCLAIALLIFVAVIIFNVVFEMIP